MKVASFRRLVVLIDIALAVAAALAGLAWYGVRAVSLRRRSASRGSERSILYLGTGNMDQVGPRNGANLFLTGECSDFGGFFERVYNVSFPAGQRKEWQLTPRHLLIDFDVSLAAALDGLGLRLLARVTRELGFLDWGIAFVREREISILEATNPYLQGLNAYLLSRASGLPYAILITRHYDFDYESIGKLAFPTVFPGRRIEKLVERWVLRHADLVLADRAHYLNYALANGATPSCSRQTRVIVDAAYYEDPRSRPNPRSALGLADGRLMLCLGRLQPEKFPGDALDCLAGVRAGGLDARLAYAGDGELRPQLERTAEQLGIRPYVHFLGSVALDLLPGLVSAADVVVCPHMGYTLLEVALSGRPIVTYDYEWHSEVIRHGETGVLVPFRDVRAMAEWTGRILRDAALAEHLGTSARQFGLRNHQRDAVMEQYRLYYAEVLGSVQGPAEQAMAQAS